jgi:hypothetical protein
MEYYFKDGRLTIKDLLFKIVYKNNIEDERRNKLCAEAIRTSQSTAERK